ncbi:aminoacyl-tRNA hydrolase [Candidatus Parcubacteria bacterium]|nr:aminoacyl-tRNA hydrolase [Patescibacteria group bacterium]MCG2694128.1 aminoacyl-tRNA hydrolase [Candidatus Parcubacteria bacterium]
MSYKLLVGLGNPGRKYEKTRHNAGFLAVDFLRKKLDAPAFKLNKKLKAEISETKSGKEKIILAKPTTFMNNSGEALASVAKFYKIKTENIIVFHDDMDIAFGDVREVFARGSAGHNGVQSIIDILGTKDFNRVRIGVGRPEKTPPESYVLQKFKPKEIEEIKEAIKKIHPLS